MSSLDSTTSQLGDYLLRGWTLLDQVCANCFTPLVRSPAPNRQCLCVRCGRDTTSNLPNGTHASPTNETSGNVPAAGYHPFVNGDDMDSDDEALEAGVMQVDATVRAVETSESDLARREQSDHASKLIGEKLLQGYCLLDEVCPTETCFGIPLLRLPRETERRTCVICQRIYPETTRQTSPLATPATLPQNQVVQQPISSILQSAPLGQFESKESLERAYRALANELVRLTESLARYDTGAKEYDECLVRVHRVVETMHTMRK